MGVWIETAVARAVSHPLRKSHPAWVCGLKPSKGSDEYPGNTVTPCVGVWIETIITCCFIITMQSHPAWVCGLKYAYQAVAERGMSHTLRGCVD